MQKTTTRLGLTAALAALLGTAACRSPAKPDAALLNDLDQASAVGIEMAPSANGTQVVSAIEAVPSATKRTATPQRVARQPAPRKAPSPQRAPTPEPQVAAHDDAPAPTPEPVVTTPAPTPRPTPAPQPTPTRRGRVWSTGDVIRNAPFPINP